MTDWANIELHFANSGHDPTFQDMCDNAISYDFCFCVLPSKLVKAKGNCVAIISPIAYFEKFKHIPSCPIYIDDILPLLEASLDVENEWFSYHPIHTIRDMLIRLGYVESKELETFFLDIYGNMK